MEFTSFGYNWVSSGLWVSQDADGGFSFGTEKKEGGSSSGTIAHESAFGYGKGFGRGVYEWVFAHPAFDHGMFSFGAVCGDVKIVCASGSMAACPDGYRRNIIETSIHPTVIREGEDMAPMCGVKRVFRWELKDRRPNRYFLIWSDRAVKVFYNSNLVMDTSDPAVLDELGRCDGKMSPYFTEGFRYTGGEVNRMPEHAMRDARLSYFRYTPFE